MLTNIWQWLTDNGTALGVVLALLPMAWVPPLEFHPAEVQSLDRSFPPN